MDIKIQHAKSADWQIIQKLNNQVFESDKDKDDDLDLSWPFSSEGIEYYKNLANGEYGKCLIAFINEIPIGYVALAIKDFGHRKSKYLEIENIGVDPAYRSQGVGKLLLDKTIELAKEIKAAKLYVSAYWGNKRAIAFYKKNGFYESGLELEKKL